MAKHNLIPNTTPKSDEELKQIDLQELIKE